MRKTLLASTLLAIAATAPAAFAHEAGDIIVRAGAIHLGTHESSSKIKVDLAGGKVPGTKATLNNDTQLGLNLAWMVTDHIAVELLAASPFELTVKQKGLSGKGLGNFDDKLGKGKVLPPTLSALYYPLDKASAFQPYVGLGVNRTLFFNEKANKSAGYSGLRLKNSWGWAAQVGADYMLTDNLMLNGQVRYIDLSTKASLHAADGAAAAKVKLDVKPVVYMLGLGYKF